MSPRRPQITDVTGDGAADSGGGSPAAGGAGGRGGGCPSPGRGAPRVFWGVYAACWAVFVCGYVVMILSQSERGVAEAAFLALQFTLPAAALGVAVVHLGRRLAWPPDRPVRFGLLHLGSASVYALVWGTSVRLVFGLRRHLVFGQSFEMPSYGNTIIGLHLLFGLVVYGAVAGGTYLADVGGRLEAERERAARAEALRARAQLEALRARLDPHFLFNALHSALSLIRRDPERAEGALERLGDLLRYAVSDGEGGRPERVTLRREMEMVETYLELEKIRLGDRLAVEVEVPDEAANALVPPLTVQPLVENAVQHGVSASTAGGTLRLRAALDGDADGGRLQVSVEDDGPGADPDSVEASDGHGLRLVRRRLELAYGGDAGLAVETTPGEGFEARVRVPVEEGGV